MEPNKSQDNQGLTKTPSSKNLLQKLQQGDKMFVNMHLSKFKERGTIVFNKLFEISLDERIPALSKTEDGKYQVLIALTASLKSMFSNINLRVGLNEDQLIEIAELVIDQSHEDNFALEDFLLFGQKFLVGEYGKIYDRMDVPTFFEFFEKYRQVRHESILAIREEEHAQFKSMGRGPSGTTELKRGEDPSAILSLMQTLYQEKNGNE